MSILTFVSKEPRTLVGMVQYATREINKEAILFLDGIGLNPNYAVEEMLLTKQLFNNPGGRQYRQIILSFDADTRLPLITLKELAYQVGLYYGREYPTLIAGHIDTSNFHIHYILNTVNAKTGEKFRSSLKDICDFKLYANKIFKKYGLTPIKMNIPDNYLSNDATKESV